MPVGTFWQSIPMNCDMSPLSSRQRGGHSNFLVSSGIFLTGLLRLGRNYCDGSSSVTPSMNESLRVIWDILIAVASILNHKKEDFAKSCVLLLMAV